MNGEIFQYYVTHHLAPTLKPDDIVIMDNLGNHEGKAVRKAITAAGAHLLFLPPYSPDLNPIENLFLKLTTLLRAAAQRTVDALWDKVGEILNQISTTECQNYIRHAGYA